MFILFALIFMRMTGAVALNPILGRSNIPNAAPINIFLHAKSWLKTILFLSELRDTGKFGQISFIQDKET